MLGPLTSVKLKFHCMLIQLLITNTHIWILSIISIDIVRKLRCVSESYAKLDFDNLIAIYSLKRYFTSKGGSRRAEKKS